VEYYSGSLTEEIRNNKDDPLISGDDTSQSLVSLFKKYEQPIKISKAQLLKDIKDG